MKIYTIIFYFIASIVFSQYNEIQPPDNIKSLQIFNPQSNDNTPIIRLNSDEYLIFLFDDINAGYKRYQYTIEHRNADWSESGAFQSEYFNGVNYDYARVYKNSFNTYQRYTNYQIQFPNQQMNVKLPGNYILKVYLDNQDKPLFTQRFAIYEQLVDVDMLVSRFNNPTNPELNQRLQINVISSTQNLTEVPDGAKLFLMKNNNWKESYFVDRPTFSRSNQLTYNNPDILFPGGSEYNWFDNKNLGVASMTTEKTFRKDSVYHTVLHPDIPKKNFVYDDYPDINGNFYIRSIRYGNEYAANSEADYSWVYFALDTFDDQNGLYVPYVVGAFNNWTIDEKSKLKKDDSGLWVTELFLKQGYYNYQYVAKNTKTGKIDPTYVSGSFWQAENQYQALFYYHPWGKRYDVLMGVGTGNSRR
ncbi:type IX secretion system plug protein domain-containing protein [Chishuiella sp.]|uniref:type IX secretion system plug protein n=1 Tax=Chishuiella sp. TaxID=1969467 RepID=UPI0028A5EBC7|nr:type IX secretion system plug protein domain-containing protein [Chishuiella sp.]